MSYTYLLDLYTALDKRVAGIEDELGSETVIDEPQRHHLAGRRDCLKMIHSYLLNNYDQKLPRRMQMKAEKQHRN